MPKKIEFTVGSGNVFADLGLPDSEELLAKAELAQQISAIIAERKLTQVDAARIMQVDQPKVSALTRGRLSEFSLERLMWFLVRLGRDVEIVVKPRSDGRKKARLQVA